MDEPVFTGWRRWGGFLAILIALVIPVTLAAKAWQSIHHSPVVKISIRGFDPRDLLRGHYLLFRFDWNWQMTQAERDAACADTACVLCLAAVPVDPPATLMPAPAATPVNCPIRVDGVYQGGDEYDIGLNRYYVAESSARVWEGRLRDRTDEFRMGLSLLPTGKVMLEKLYFAGVPIENYTERSLTVEQE